jgi:hypothetical protein
LKPGCGLKIGGLENPSGKKVTQFPERGMSGTHDHMVNQFNLEQLPGADEIAGDFYIRLGRG